MKLMFASDIHGSEFYCKKMIDAYKMENADRLILLGDILYHGPRNDLPKDYNPKAVISLLNAMKNEILCVRGNCEAEVDQMVLEFPVLADYMTMFVQNYMLFITHGHLYNEDKIPPLKKGDILIHGHTHIPVVRKHENYTYINPGSVSIPKNDSANSYMILKDNTFTIKNFNGTIVDTFSTI